jgi:hypothetical protein
MMPPRPPQRPDEGTKMPMPKGIEPTPPSVRRESGIPMRETTDKLAPQSLDQLARRSGKK